MSKESTQPVPLGSPEQEQEPVSLPELAPRSSLPPELDPSSFTERAPSILSLLPDDGLSQALSRGDASALHEALTDRMARESSGPVRDTLRQLLEDRRLFTVAESPPRIAGFLGTGVQWAGLPSPEAQQTPFIATRAVRLFGVPLWPLGEHLVQRGRDGQLQVLGRVAAGSGSLSTRRAGFAALGALILAGASAALAPFVVREVHIVNGLSRRVEVRLDGEHRVLDPGQIIQQQVYGLGGPYEVEARWPGANKPFEVLTVGSEQRTLYNILGAAFLKWEEPVAPSGPDWLPARVYSLPPETQVVSRGGWEAQLRAYVEAGLWQRAAALAKAVFLADPSQIQAGREAARLLVQSDPQQALWFVRGLPQAFPDDPAVAQLALDVLTVLDERSVASRLYEAQAQSAPHSVKRALMAAMAAPPEQVRDAYARVLERFSDSPQAMRAVARIRLADGYPRQALELLEDALELGPESLEDLELRVRALVAEGDVLKASMAVKQFHGDPRHASWELAVLAGRLAWIAGPGRTQYVARDLLPSKLSNSPEHLAAFALLTGESSVSDKELNAVGDPMAREALALTRALLKNFEAAVEQAALARPPVLSRLDPETAAVLALELSRLGQKEAAQRVFGSSLALLAARAPLQAYVNTGTVKPEFALLPPGLQAAAYLIRARASEDSRRVEQKYALWADALGGMARQVFGVKEAEPKMWQDPKYQFREHPPHHHAPIRWHTIQGTTTQPPLDSGQPPPERTGERLPRPWPASER